MPSSANKPGRRSYGPRAVRTVRYPADYDPILERIAKESGLHIGSWLALAVSQQAGLEIPDYVKDELEKAERERAARETERELDMLDMPKSA